MKTLTEREEIYKKAHALWGIDSQIDVTYEEISEWIIELCKLVKLLSKRKRVLNGSDNEQIVNEIADCLVMMESISLIFGKEEIDKKRDEKVKRLESWINEKKRVW